MPPEPITPAEPGVRPFDSGSQYADWIESNCAGCTLYDAIEYRGRCDIDGALGFAYLGDGLVSPEIARRMGAIEHAGEFTWRCPEWRTLDA